MGIKFSGGGDQWQNTLRIISGLATQEQKGKQQKTSNEQAMMRALIAAGQLGLVEEPITQTRQRTPQELGPGEIPGEGITNADTQVRAFTPQPGGGFDRGVDVPGVPNRFITELIYLFLTV